MTNIISRKALTLCATSVLALGYAGLAQAQTASEALRDVITVTATKKAGGVNIQDAPVAITAFGEAQLEVLNVTDLQSLSYSVPNVSLEDIGTARGVANFSIRGLGVNSSIPSIDPTVGVFVDGVYLGINAGVVFDVFDLEGIEILRGPQGILFGRNVTGGAVLLNTKKPGDTVEASFKAGVESGLRGTGSSYTLSAAVSGPLVEDKLAGKVAVYYNRDDGYFKNFEGGPNFGQPDEFNNFGESDTILFRTALTYTPNSNTEFVLRLEHGNSTGDGPASQNHASGTGQNNPFFSADRNSFGLSIDEDGFSDNTWNQYTFETNIDVAFGNGTITNIFGYREFSSAGRSDIDATPAFLFHASFATEQDQWSNELRYSGNFGDRFGLTAGLYYFTQNIAYQETRNIAGGALNFFGGGVQDQETFGAFAQGDFSLTDTVTLNLGARITREEKTASVATLIFNQAECDVITGTCPFDFNDSDSWSNFSPKVGLTWEANDEWNVYGHWVRGFRSGGYNFRNTSAVFNSGPFDEETVDSFEIGLKGQPGNSLRINSAVFYNNVANLQREINLADPFAGVVQIIRNTADATIWGFETEAQFFVTDNLTLLASLGHTNGSYDDVFFDLNGDTVLDQADLDLNIPRLAPWTYSFGFVFDHVLDSGAAWSLRANYAHRDDSFFTDNNLGTLNGANIVDFDLGFTTASNVSFSLYGKNILDEVTHGGDTQLPIALGGGAFAPLNKGRIFGLEMKVSLN